MVAAFVHDNPVHFDTDTGYSAIENICPTWILDMSHADTECVEHIKIIITSMKNADNVIPNLD